MATAGERYEDRTGNIWSYAHRGDMSGLRAALARGVSPDMANTVGWTPSHAAAAGGHTKALRLLANSGADLEIADRGGNLPVHSAAKHGHVHALRVLKELGADVTKVRLSHAKGQAVRNLLIEAYRKADMTTSDGEEGDDAPVGYARKQAKSTAFWGPRRTPISTKIKKKIIKENRLKRKEKKVTASNDTGQSEERTLVADENNTAGTVEMDAMEGLSYVETVRTIKRNKKQKQRQQQGRKQHTRQNDDDDNKTREETSCDSSVLSDVSEGDEHNNALSKVYGFAALSILDDSGSDSEE